MPVHFRRGHRDSGEFIEMNCNWLLFLIFLFVPGLRENEDSGCYRREGVSRWGTYNFSGTWNLNFFLSFSCLCFFFFLFGIDLQSSITWTNLAFIVLIFLIYLTTSWMFGEWTVCILLQIYSITLASGYSFSHLCFRSSLCKDSRWVCLQKLKLNVCAVFHEMLYLEFF